MEEREARSSGGSVYTEGRRSAATRKVRVRVGLDTGFMALDLILYTHEVLWPWTYFEIMTHLNVEN